ncbi:GMP synthase (glutamine-hydrolysing) [Rhodovulum bhavnagarense]|uniref:GMP synthase (Glutamine-hydrolysing) n=1 Tax=Rhodovulum bhavnagarense TaxID=992286 RepID=A0A4R2RJ61_9RHOB|nr:type 1 glutamine amidotransferase [Rhodovulum bhavnagarense]TCP63083.1 GMP synthase (glutamine-hydrolysing) [Rhodovulum bhavnagarense]
MQIGLLEAGHAAEIIRAEHGDYRDMFTRILEPHGLSFRAWDVEGMQFPESVHDAEGWLISGSRHGVYEDHPFIPPLEEFIRAAYDAGIPLVGICFGHQIVAQALGGRVEKFAGGWSVGSTAYTIEGRPITLNAWHQDQVLIPPETAQTVGCSPFCAHAALIYNDRILTLQPHPEFDRGIIADMIAHRGSGIVPDPILVDATARLDRPTDGPDMAARIARFFKERR